MSKPKYRDFVMIFPELQSLRGNNDVEEDEEFLPKLRVAGVSAPE